MSIILHLMEWASLCDTLEFLLARGYIYDNIKNQIKEQAF